MYKAFRKIKGFFGSISCWVRNVFLCIQYPFWRQTEVWTGRKLGFSYTWYDAIAKGWKKAFGKQLSRDLKEALRQARKIDPSAQLCWVDIKEKWGELILDASAPNEVQQVLRKYEVMSLGYCQSCGEPVRYCTRGWVTYLCEKCFDEYEGQRFTNPLEFKEYKTLCEVTADMLPKASEWDALTNRFLPVDYQKRYGIDFKELWGIEE